MAEKNALYLSVSRYLARRVLIGDGIFLRLQLETGPPFCVVIRAMRRSNFLQCKGSTFFSSVLFKTLSKGLTPGIKPVTFHSAVKRSTN